MTQSNYPSMVNDKKTAEIWRTRLQKQRLSDEIDRYKRITRCEAMKDRW
ncbi:hypothetical protein Q9R46_13370 [Paenibacillus sp. RRE4]|nr:hypothetical protein [Paenibacillus sp. RRE4]MDT0123643.1 hypothetical protein [Paenibacillus sp. RRE4]